MNYSSPTTIHATTDLSGIGLSDMNTFEIIMKMTKEGSECIGIVLKVNGAYNNYLEDIKDSGFNFTDGVHPFIGGYEVNNGIYINRLELRTR